MKEKLQNLVLGGALVSTVGLSAFNSERTLAQTKQIEQSQPKQEFVLKLSQEELDQMKRNCTNDKLSRTDTNFVQGSLISLGFMGLSAATLYNIRRKKDYSEDGSAGFAASFEVPLAIASWPLTIEAANQYNRSQNYTQNNCAMIKYELPNSNTK